MPGVTSWELALVTTSSNDSAINQRKLVFLPHLSSYFSSCLDKAFFTNPLFKAMILSLQRTIIEINCPISCLGNLRWIEIEA
jgi:hypothetical protein